MSSIIIGLQNHIKSHTLVYANDILELWCKKNKAKIFLFVVYRIDNFLLTKINCFIQTVVLMSCLKFLTYLGLNQISSFWMGFLQSKNTIKDKSDEWIDGKLYDWIL